MQAKTCDRNRRFFHKNNLALIILPRHAHNDFKHSEFCTFPWPSSCSVLTNLCVFKVSPKWHLKQDQIGRWGWLWHNCQSQLSKLSWSPQFPPVKHTFWRVPLMFPRANLCIVPAFQTGTTCTEREAQKHQSCRFCYPTRCRRHLPMRPTLQRHRNLYT